MELLWETSFR